MSAGAPTAGRSVLAALAAAGTAAGTLRVRAAIPGSRRFDRENHRGETVTMLEGPAYALGAVTGLALGTSSSGSRRSAAILATAGAALLGAVDDLAETGSSKGLRGHLGALLRGEVTTGAVKVIGISGFGVLAAALALPRSAGTSRLGHLAEVLVGGGVVAGSANLFNLLDLRPGRALKAAVIAVAVQGGVAAFRGEETESGMLSASLGATAGSWPSDLQERSMLGDSGANAAGALLGTHLVATAGRRGRLLALAGIVAATLVSEKVSFTRIIESTPVLRDIDAFGRRAGTGAAAVRE